MKVEDLMIGDWVQYQYTGGIFQIVEISKTEGIKQFESQPFFKLNGIIPISITPEILEKNGFKADFELKGCYWRPDCRKYCIVKEIETWHLAFRIGGGHICVFECNYVHELQHALKLCGIDKEIVI